ncbi:hypothetical protein ANN_11690 [Periplaneta americana]|uniref:Anoctamin n=1 Tax=Periplaneta americana TaxID=6978 RepID=A0ABQ8T6V3_PERAM|nr:hypothetical protein ANN_11690 [Periplaneta americana]
MDISDAILTHSSCAYAEEIRLYFGEAVALYFTFLGYYTTALLVPMVLGFLQLVLSTESIAFFCVFNVLWVTVFLEVWKRKCSELAFTWGTIGMTSLDEPRPNYRGTMGIDKVTGRYQPQFPRWKTNARLYCVSLPIVLLCMVAAFFVMLASFWAEELIINMRKEQGLDSSGVIVLLPSIVYSALVFILNLYYRMLATWLTEWENHRTQSQFDRHRVTKLVLFEFVNNFMSLFYIAFYIQDMEMLKYQLTVMLIIFQAINNFQEAILPLLIKLYSKRQRNKVLRFGTWNVTSLYRTGGVTLVAKELARYRIDFVEVQEVRLDGNGISQIGDYLLYYGEGNNNHQIGTGLNTVLKRSKYNSVHK